MMNQHLRYARKEKRWSIERASEYVGVDRVTFSRWERGLQDPHLSTLDLLCQVFEQTPQALGFAHLLPEKPGQMVPTQVILPTNCPATIIPFPLERVQVRQTARGRHA